MESAAARSKAEALACSATEAEAATEESKRERNGIMRLPDWFIERTRKSGLQRPQPLPEGSLDDDPEYREMVLAAKSAYNAYVDVQEDILNQVNEKGYAQVMYEYVDGVPKLGIIPKA